MKVTLTPDGAITVEGGTPKETAAVLRELRPTKSTPRRTAPEPEPETESDEVLNAIQVQTWNWLVANDVPNGLRAGDMAEDLNISKDTAMARLISLNRAGVAYKVGRGRYRAGAS